MRYLLLALLVVTIPCCASRKQKVIATPPDAASTGQLSKDSTESQMIAARAHLEMGCPSNAAYDVFRQGLEYRVQVKYVTGYGPNKEPLHAVDQGAVVLLDKEGKLINIDRSGAGPEAAPAATNEEAVVSDLQSLETINAS